MHVSLDIPRSLALYTDAIEGLTRINERLYREAKRSGKPLPSIYAGGVRYEREYPGEEDWKHVMRVIADGVGDCEDLSAARAGELRANGEALARAEVRRTGPKMTHAFVVRANGKIEDPSRRLGMAGPRRPTTPVRTMARPAQLSRLLPQLRGAAPQLVRPVTTFAQRAAATASSPAPVASSSLPPSLAPGWSPSAAGPEPLDSDVYGDLDDYDDDDDGEDDEIGADPVKTMEVSWSLDRTASGWKGTIRVPLIDGRCMLVGGKAEGPASGPAAESAKKAAINKGLSAASKVLDNPAVAALLPPQAALALKLAKSAPAKAIAKKLSKWF